MSEVIVTNAVIEKATLTINDKGILDAWLMLDYGGSGQGFGGYALHLPKSFTHYSLLSPAGHFLYRVMEIAGVEEWHHLRGRCIRVRREDFGKIHAIGHIVKDDWFDPAHDFASLKKEEA